MINQDRLIKNMNNQPEPKHRTGLVMMGGGARAAYQVGVLKAIAELVPDEAPSPFAVLCGTSAGAINATALAANIMVYKKAIRRLLAIWENFHVHHVYRSDLPGILKTGFRWLMAFILVGMGKHNPQYLFDRKPLRKLLEGHLNLKTIQSSIDSGILHAISVSASGYTSGQSVAFYQGKENIQPWKRARRVGCKTDLTIDHLMASSAIPFIFEPVRINREYFGDGSMRQVAPISAALHLGADKILVIGNRYENREDKPVREITEGPPSIAQIAGHVLSSIFLDALETDLERLQRINKTISLIPTHILEEGGIKLKQVDTLCISPSEDIDMIARKHVNHLPRTIRILLKGIGAYRKEGASLISYLLFEKPYCCDLIELGYKDAMNQKSEIQQLLGLEITQ